MRKQIQKFICKLLEEELITILAVSIVMLGIVFVRADVASTNLSFSVAPPGGSITVTAPNGGESWTIGTSQNITWETVGEVDNVKIELQRSVGGSWEEIVASTTNDGSHPWTVTSPATTSAKIKITEVGDDTVTDQSDEVFSIVAAGGGGGGYSPGGGIAPTPAVDLVTPRSFINNSDVSLAVRGSNFEADAKVWLGSRALTTTLYLGYELRVAVPKGFPAGQYQLKVVNPSGQTGIYGTAITVVEQTTEALIVDQSPTPLTLLPGEKVEAWVKVKNTSNYTWVRDGVNQVQLGVPGDKKSLFYDPATWIIPHRAARMEESSVAYGQVGTFRFYIKAPLKVGDYTDTFQLLIENIKWLNSVPISWQVKVKSIVIPPTTGGEEYYSAKFVKQSPRLELNPGEEATLWVDFENTGTVTWTSTGKNPVRIGTDKPRDRNSKFKGAKWVLRNRPAAVESVTAPGTVGRFSFTIKAPRKAGQYREYFGLVAEHKTWISGGQVTWEIVVKKPMAAKTTKVTPPATGGGIKYTSPASLLFTDSIERFLNQLGGWLGHWWGWLTI